MGARNLQNSEYCPADIYLIPLEQVSAKINGLVSSICSRSGGW